MMIPGLVWYFCFHLLPLFGLTMAFYDYKPARGFAGSEFVGFQNFQTLFTGPEFFTVLGNTLKISVLKLICGFPAPILLALSINTVQRKMFRKFTQTVSYLPNFLSWVIVFGISSVLFNEYSGVVENMFFLLGIPYTDWTLNPSTFILFIVISAVWKGMGMSSIVYLAALSGIDPQLYEAAQVDGASRFRQLWSITLPSLLPTCAIVLILSVGTLLGGDFEQLYLFQRGNPTLVNKSDIFETWIVRNGITNGKYSLSTALGLFQSFFGACLILITNWIAKKMGNVGVW